jgi:hypothetical protein
VEAESEQAVRDDFTVGNLDFGHKDIIDGDDFNLLSIEPVDN